MWRHFFYPAAGGQQCPTSRVTELQIEVGHFQSAIRVPGTASANIEQSGPGFRQHVTSIDEVQVNFLTRAKRLGKDYCHKVVPAARQLSTFQRLIVNKLDRLAIGGDFADLEEP